MNIDPEVTAFILAAKEAEEKGLLSDLDDRQLEKLKYEIAEDPDILRAIRKIFNT